MDLRSVVVIAAVLTSGCASAPSRKEAAPAVQDHEALQVVRIETLGPQGPLSSRCGVKNDRGTSEILAPGVAEVVRSAKPLEILCFTPGYRIAMRSLESTGDVIGSAATGVVAGGAMSAVAALPLLTVPVFGPLMYAGAVGGAALLGGAVNAADKHSQGKIYSYPPSAIVSMVPEGAMPGGAAAPHARALTAVEPVPIAASPTSSAAPVAPSAPMAQPALAAPQPVPPAPSPAFRVASSATAPLLPIAHEVPAFPGEAAQAGVASGNVRALLAIDAEGNVTAVRILEARPERVFDRAVNESLARWKFPRGDASRQFEAEIEFRR
ncbi:MAG TPA: TonB family protein [Usitatibacter sp.]|nr:TonB family protein [Usitatibacter sp.]